MARDDERHGVVSECRADGPDGLGPADLGGDPAIRADLAPRDLERLAPHVLFEAGVTTEVERDPDAAIAIEPSSDRVREAGGDLGRDRLATSRTKMARFEGLLVAGKVDRHDADPVPRHDERAERRLVDPPVAIQEADLDQDRRPQRRRCPDREVGQGCRLGIGDLELGRHAVISSGSGRVSASSIVRSNAIPRWTWALTVPSGLPRASAASGYVRPSTWRRTMAVR